jgi:hypothetical protein
MDIIDKLLQQLNLIKSILDKEVKEQEYCYQYHIFEGKNIFLDISQLRAYLTETEIKNTIFLKKINTLCIQISNIWVNELQMLERKALPNSENKILDFHLFIIGKDGVTNNYISSNESRIMNMNNLPEFKDINWISKRCDSILEYITDAYPETIPDNKINSDNILNNDRDIDSETDKLIYNPNFINEMCYKLFFYLIDNYEKNGKVKLINIFYFLKNHVDKKIFVFAFKQEKYKEFIMNNYNVKINKFQKAQYEFDDIEVPILRELTKNFLDTLE